MGLGLETNLLQIVVFIYLSSISYFFPLLGFISIGRGDIRSHGFLASILLMRRTNNPMHVVVRCRYTVLDWRKLK